MKNIPVTFLFEHSHYPEAVRRSMLHELALCGVKHIVLTDTMISQIITQPAFAGVLQNELASEGLSFMDSHAPFGPSIDMNVFDENHIVAAKHQLHLHIAALMKVKTITIHIGNNHKMPGTPFEIQFDNILRMLEQLLPTAGKLGVKICIENIWTKINTPETLLRIKEYFPSDNLGFCFDSGHANIMQYGWRYPEGNANTAWQLDNSGTPTWDDKILEKMLPHIVNCHLHDNMAKKDQHTLPGRGCIDWQKLRDTLLKAPRLEVIQSEVIARRNSLSIKELVDGFNAVFKG